MMLEGPDRPPWTIVNGAGLQAVALQTEGWFVEAFQRPIRRATSFEHGGEDSHNDEIGAKGERLVSHALPHLVQSETGHGQVEHGDSLKPRFQTGAVGLLIRHARPERERIPPRVRFVAAP